MSPDSKVTGPAETSTAGSARDDRERSEQFEEALGEGVEVASGE